MEVIGWIVVVLLFAVGIAGAFIPILPGAIAIYAAFFAYGFFFTFQPLGFWFWTIETLIVALLFVADHAVSAWGVKKYGGSRASIIGSMIGIVAGPFVIPAFGLLLGPLLGAVIGELIAGSDVNTALKAGLGAVVGLFTSTVVKIILQAVMIMLFFVWITL